MKKLIWSTSELKEWVKEHHTVPGVYGCQVAKLVIILMVKDDIGQEFKVFLSGENNEEVAVYQILF